MSSPRNGRDPALDRPALRLARSQTEATIWHMMNILDPTGLRREHPVDVVERLAWGNSWAFERLDDEISFSVAGERADYSLAFTWLDDIEALHVGCAFDFKIPADQRPEVLDLIGRINARSWIGHFDLWPTDGVVMFRHALLLSGGALPTRAQCERILHEAVAACERYFEAFELVVRLKKSVQEALDWLMLETQGHA